MTESNSCAVAVHAGAGYHSREKESIYKRICSTACKRAMVKLNAGVSALDAVSIAVQILEDSPLTNAGTGSSLTMSGTVECDASVMDGQSLMFGAVGAVTGVKNPVMVAKKLVEKQRSGNMSLGRIPPCTLVGPGATEWAQQHGLPCVSQDLLKTDLSKKTYESHKRRLESAEERRNNKRRKHLQGRLPDGSSKQDKTEVLHKSEEEISESVHVASTNNTRIVDNIITCHDDVTSTGHDITSAGYDVTSVGYDVTSTGHDVTHTGYDVTSAGDVTDDITGIQDTVGAVCIDREGNFAAAVSSGGISLKQPGRLGSAALYGCGCWASNWRPGGKPGVAVATSGTGEHLIKTLLARECAQYIQTEECTEQAINMLLKDRFLESDVLRSYSEKYGGVLVLKMDGSEQELIWGHTTDSMCIGFMTSSSKVKTIISRLDEQQAAGKTSVIQGMPL